MYQWYYMMIPILFTSFYALYAGLWLVVLWGQNLQLQALFDYGDPHRWPE